MLNKKTGHFNLTAPRISRWWRRTGEPPTLSEAAQMLIDQGIHVFQVNAQWIDCEFLPDKIWQIFSGQPSNPKYLKHYLNQYKRWQERASK